MNECSLDFFDTTYQNFLKAIAKVDEIKVFYQLAGFTFCLKFAGPAMVAAMAPALAHLEVSEPEECDLTICIWDSVSTHNDSIPLPASHHSYAIRGEMLGYDSDRIHSVLDIHTKVLHLYDKHQQLALYWIKDARQLPWWIGGSPLLLILHWWMRTKHHQLTHAAVVGDVDGGVLLAGKGGTGKTTTTLACMRAGLKFVSEDYCLVSDMPDAKAFCVYNSAKLREKTLQMFPEIHQHIFNTSRNTDQKAFIFHHQFQPEKILNQCPLKALVTLKIEESADSWLEPIDPINAIPALAVSTIWQLTHTGLAVFNHLKRITQALPCYQLHLGSDLMQAPALLERLL